MRWTKAVLGRALVCLLVGVAATPLHAIDSKTEQLVALDAIFAELKTHYGLIRFKQAELGISYERLRDKYATLVNEAMTVEESLGFVPRVTRDVLPPDEFRQILVALGAEFRDGHTNIGRQTYQGWTTGIHAAAIEGKLYITGFDSETYVKGRAYPEPKVGDEILAVDGVPVGKLAREILPYIQGATYRSRYHDALEMLLSPSHRWGRRKETGAPVRITFQHLSGGKDEDTKKPRTFDGHYFWVARHDLAELKRFRQFVDDKPAEPHEDGPWEFGRWGHYHSFFQEGLDHLSLPAGAVIELGQLINAQIGEARGKKPKKEEKKKDAARRGPAPEEEPDRSEGDEAESGLAKLLENKRIHVQIVRYDGKQIGILRIPDYGPFGIAPEMHWLAEAVKQLEGATDALIIDQLTNPGGYIWHFAEIAGLFAHEKPMNLGTMDIRLSETFFAAHEHPSHPDYDLEKLLHDQRLNFGHLTLHRKTMEQLRRRFDAGERWSGPLAFGAPQTYLLPGVAGRMFARNDVAYTKPILLLNDERSGSGGDFFPATLQANGRGVVMGETSLGLGGPVYRQQASMPGSEMTMRCTYGMCFRADGLPIENVGVVPDIERTTTVDDLRGNFSAYAKEALQVAVRLANGATVLDLKAEHQKKRLEAANRVTKTREYEETAKIIAELKIVADTETDPEVVAAKYREGLARLRQVDLGRLEEQHWKVLILPIPKILVHTDPILASLSDGASAANRLTEMRGIERYAEGSPLRGPLDALASGMEGLEKVRLHPCLAELAKPAVH